MAKAIQRTPRALANLARDGTAVHSGDDQAVDLPTHGRWRHPWQPGRVSARSWTVIA